MDTIHSCYWQIYTSQCLWMLQTLSHVSWDMDRTTLLHLHKVVILAKLDYGCPLNLTVSRCSSSKPAPSARSILMYVSILALFSRWDRLVLHYHLCLFQHPPTSFPPTVLCCSPPYKFPCIVLVPNALYGRVLVLHYWIELNCIWLLQCNVILNWESSLTWGVKCVQYRQHISTV